MRVSRSLRQNDGSGMRASARVSWTPAVAGLKPPGAPLGRPPSTTLGRWATTLSASLPTGPRGAGPAGDSGAVGAPGPVVPEVPGEPGATGRGSAGEAGPRVSMPMGVFLLPAAGCGPDGGPILP